MCSLEGKDQRQFGALHQKRERHQSDLHRAANAGATILHLLVSLSVTPLTIARLNLFRVHFSSERASEGARLAVLRNPNLRWLPTPSGGRWRRWRGIWLYRKISQRERP